MVARAGADYALKRFLGARKWNDARHEANMLCALELCFHFRCVVCVYCSSTHWILSRHSHPHVIRFHGMLTDEAAILLELCNGRSLHDYLFADKQRHAFALILPVFSSLPLT